MTKRFYNQPRTNITYINGMTMMQAVSPAPGAGSGAGKVNTGIETDDQW